MSEAGLDDVKAAAKAASDKAKDAYDRGAGEVQDALAKLEAYAKANPWIAIGAALGTGLLVGRITARTRGEVVFVRKVPAGEVA